MTPLTVHFVQALTIVLLTTVLAVAFRNMVWRPYFRRGRHAAPRTVADPVLTDPVPDYVPDEWDHDSDWTADQLAALNPRLTVTVRPSFDINRVFTPSGEPLVIWPPSMTDREIDTWLDSGELAVPWWTRRR